mgnify:CR=1 FL=1
MIEHDRRIIDAEPGIRQAAPTFPFLSDYKRVWEMDQAKDAYAELREYFRHFDPRHEREDAVFETLGYVDIQHLARRIQPVLPGDALTISMWSGDAGETLFTTSAVDPGDPSTERIVIDHCSFSWATDENVQSSANDITLRHNIISEGVHKVEDIEENVNTLLFALMNPEDKKNIQDLPSFSDRIEYIHIPYVLDLNTEIEGKS